MFTLVNIMTNIIQTFKWYLESIAHISLFRNVDMLSELKYSILLFELLSSAKILK
jgi:hypothetical protein